MHNSEALQRVQTYYKTERGSIEYLMGVSCIVSMAFPVVFSKCFHYVSYGGVLHSIHGVSGSVFFLEFSIARVDYGTVGSKGEDTIRKAHFTYRDFHSPENASRA